MKIGVPKEIKAQENRVAVVTAGVEQLVADGHDVFVQKSAGIGSGIDDAEYVRAGAKMLDTAKEVWDTAEMIVKVKEPLPDEYPLCRPDLTLFTYFHFAASKQLTDAMLKAGSACFTYETLEVDGELPLLDPMSEVAGRLAIQAAAWALEKKNGGRGVLMGGVPGVDPADVMIIGGGAVGTNAAKMAAGMGANVTILDIDLKRLRYLDDVMPANVTTIFSSPQAIRQRIRHCDVVIGAVLLEGARAPTLVPRSYLKEMRPGAVIVDVAIDQGGCVETIKATTHQDPTYIVDGIVHYGVANMPGAVARTSAYALTNATLPWVRKLARVGPANALKNEYLRGALNVWKGKVTHEGVAQAFGLDCVDALSLV